MDIHVDDLAAFVFSPLRKTKFGLSLDGLESSKDLFFFLLDLFCKGMVLMFGTNGNTVDLSTISHEQFKEIEKRMARAGILLKLDVLASEGSESSEGSEGSQSSQGPQPQRQGPQHTSKINMRELASLPANSPLEAFVFQLHFNGMQHNLTFGLSRD